MNNPKHHKSHRLLRDKRPLLALVALLLLGGIGVTLAYTSDTVFFTDKDSTSRQFSVRTTHEYNRINNLTPGDSIEKNYQTTNTGDIRIAVRYFYIAQWTDAEGQPLPLGFTLEDAELGTSTQLAMKVEPNTATITDRIYSSNPFNPWRSGSLTTAYCADRVTVIDPEHYSCQETTDDPTLAYSALVGPFTYYRTLGKDESTARSPLSRIELNPELATFQHHIRLGCSYNSPMDSYMCEDPENYYSIDESQLLSSPNEIVKVETVNDSPYTNATFNLTVRAEAIEAYAVRSVWGSEEYVYEPYQEFSGWWEY